MWGNQESQVRQGTSMRVVYVHGTNTRRARTQKEKSEINTNRSLQTANVFGFERGSWITRRTPQTFSPRFRNRGGLKKNRCTNRGGEKNGGNRNSHARKGCRGGGLTGRGQKKKKKEPSIQGSVKEEIEKLSGLIPRKRGPGREQLRTTKKNTKPKTKTPTTPEETKSTNNPPTPKPVQHDGKPARSYSTQRKERRGASFRHQTGWARNRWLKGEGLSR